jgi:hypothetical protein
VGSERDELRTGVVAEAVTESGELAWADQGPEATAGIVGSKGSSRTEAVDWLGIRENKGGDQSSEGERVKR